jgi:hypothetical protein
MIVSHLRLQPTGLQMVNESTELFSSTSGFCSEKQQSVAHS